MKDWGKEPEPDKAMFNEGWFLVKRCSNIQWELQIYWKNKDFQNICNALQAWLLEYSGDFTEEEYERIQSKINKANTILNNESKYDDYIAHKLLREAHVDIKRCMKAHDLGNPKKEEDDFLRPTENWDASKWVHPDDEEKSGEKEEVEKDGDAE